MKADNIRSLKVHSNLIKTVKVFFTKEDREKYKTNNVFSFSVRSI
jgi:hypothetical protein